MQPWEVKAHRVIGELCAESYRHANIYKDGTKRSRHVPYSVPMIADQLVKALGMKDRRESEIACKQLMMALHCTPELARD